MLSTSWRRIWFHIFHATSHFRSSRYLVFFLLKFVKKQNEHIYFFQNIYLPNERTKHVYMVKATDMQSAYVVDLFTGRKNHEANKGEE